MIEELLKNVPVFISSKEGKTVIESGLTFHWSVGYECWLVGYGNKLRMNKKGTGNGATLAFAIKDFIDKQSQLGK